VRCWQAAPTVRLGWPDEHRFLRAPLPGTNVQKTSCPETKLRKRLTGVEGRKVLSAACRAWHTVSSRGNQLSASIAHQHGHSAAELVAVCGI
jgi:hypothetical protein